MYDCMIPTTTITLKLCLKWKLDTQHQIIEVSNIVWIAIINDNNNVYYLHYKQCVLFSDIPFVRINLAATIC